MSRAVTRFHVRRQVPEPALRAALTPNYPIGCRRIGAAATAVQLVPQLAIIAERVTRRTICHWLSAQAPPSMR